MKNANIQLDCPKVQELQHYLSGESSGPGFTSLDEHIASCPNCLQKLESLGQHSDFITNMIAEVIQRPPVDLGVGLQKSLEQIRNRQPEPIRNAKPQATDSITAIRDYRILESIGEGGMGCVYRAVHMRLNRPVAIKVLRQDRIHSEEAISRFSREMLLVAQLEHPNIVRALDAGEQDGLQFLVMEFLAGVDVGQLSKRLGPLPVSDTCQIIRLAALALQYAHDQKILHRDVKPSNLLVTPDGVLKLLDLGLAQFYDFSILQPSLSRADQAIGTLAYMAPEQLSRNEEVTTRADIFSLGVSFHEILTGQRPLERPGQAPLMAELLSIRPEVDENLIRLINEMVSLASTKRPQTMQEIVDRLTPYTASSDLASLVTEYFRWNSKKSPAIGSVIAPPITVSTEEATRTRVNTIASKQEGLVGRSVSKTSANINGTSVEPVRKPHWAWTAGIAATAFSIAFGYWFWPDMGSSSFPLPGPIVPTQITTGDLELVPEGEIAIQLLSDGAVFATNRNTGETSTVTNGINAMEPGTYSITVEGPEDFKPLDDIRIAKGARRKQSLTTSLTKQFAYPTIPEHVGASGTYKGMLWHVGWPDKKEVPFQMRLHVLAFEEREGSPKFVWLKIDTTTHHASGDYSETGYLKINVDRWNSENLLDVAEGYVRARGDAISQLTQDRASGSNKDGLAVPFLKERDWLREIASDALPEHRLSLHDFIALFFGDASVSAAAMSIRELRSNLQPLGKRNAWLESIPDSFGSHVPCYVASSRFREADRQTPGYSMARRKAEPFGFVSMEAKMPSLKVTCAITTSGPAKVDMSELERAKQECINPGDGPSRNQFWNLAGLPTKEGETTWQGSIEIAGSPRQIVRATARALGTESSNNRTFRWIEIEVSSTLDQGEKEHWEAARLLVDEDEYRDFGKFEAKNGWLSFGDKKTVFALPENRDLTEIIKERMMLFESPNFRRFSVIDAMAMLFDAEFNPQSMMSILRKEIFAARVGLNPKRTSVPIELGSTRPVQGELWESPQGVPFEYKIRRTSHVLFDFVHVFLEARTQANERKPEAKISLAIKNPGLQTSSKQPSAMNPMTLLQWQAETQLRVKAAIKPNWRVWTWNDSGMKFMAWAEFGGTMGAEKINDQSKRDVLLRARNGKEIRVPCNSLSDDDWDWARKGRIWKGTNPQSVNIQYNLVEDLGHSIRLQGVARQDPYPAKKFEELAPEDQTWIKSLRSASKRKYTSNEQFQEWLDFAPYIRK